MDPNQLTQVLLNCNNPDANTRSLAEKFLSDAEKANFPLYIQMLVLELANNDKQTQSRKLAGIVFKNTLTAKDENTRHQKFQRWLSLDQNHRAQIKNLVLTTLSSANKDARSTAAQVVSTVAHIELPRKVWPELIQGLLQNMQTDVDFLKQATLESLGYICEEIDSNVLSEHSNPILTAVCKGVMDPSNEVRLAGCNALFNALEFVKNNFEKEVERNYIMQVLCEALNSTDSEVRKTSMECIGKIATLYYDKLNQYMQKLFNVTLDAIKKDEEKVALQAIEFWSSICDEEIYLNEEAEEAAFNRVTPTRTSQNFIKGALKYLIPIFTECLTKQEDEPDEDSWNIAMAAGTCLNLVATCVGDEIIPQIMPFIQANINMENWKLREAATLAFGAILEGPKQIIAQLITQALPLLLAHMKDQNVYVKDTTAWTIGRICQLHPSTITGCIPQLIQTMLESINDSPKVASNVCWTIHNLALSFDESENEKQTSPLSPYFQLLMENLARTTDRSDADENNLRASAYEAINVLIQSGAKDTHGIIQNATPLFLQRLDQTFNMQLVSNDDKEEQIERQSLLCGVLHSIITTLSSDIKPLADQFMTLFLKVFGSKSATVQEEALMAVGAVANAVEGDFEKYMPHFRQYLTLGLRNYEEHQVCAVAVGVVGDVARALQNKMAPYCDEIITLLLTDLQNPMMNRMVKPPILSCFGDIALAIGGEFVKYLGVVMTVLQQASTTTVDQGDPDLVDYLNKLRESIFDAYTGIIQGLRGDAASDHLIPHVNNVLSICQTIQADPNRTPEVTRGALGVLGDLAHALGVKIKSQLAQPFVNKIIQECLKSDDQQSREVAQWVKENISQLK